MISKHTLLQIGAVVLVVAGLGVVLTDVGNVALIRKIGAAVSLVVADDGANPIVSLFDVQLRTVDPGMPVTATFTASDSGGSHLARVDLHRAPYVATNCSATNRSGCVWTTPRTATAPTTADTWTGTLVDAPTVGVWWYGLAARDNGGRTGYEPGVIQVTVRAVALTPTPTPNSDTSTPRVTAFDVQPRTHAAGSGVTASFSVTDAGGSHLKRIILNRAPFVTANCNATNRSGCQWSTVVGVNAPAISDVWTSTVSDLPAAGTWWYGFKVTDGADRAGYESAAISVVTSPATPTPTSTPMPTPGTPSNDFGVSVGASLLGVSQSELDLRLDTMLALGVTWVRFDLDWSYVQPNNASQFYWGDVDRVVAAVHARSMNVLPILDNTPVWARIAGCANSKCPPANNAAYATFAAAAAQRYGPLGVHAWEIWNEPNLVAFWQTGASATSYSDMLKAVYPAIKSQDPSATVITGGTGPAATGGGNIAPLEFLTLLYANNAKNSFDAVGFHPYSFPARPTLTASWNAWSQMALTSPSLRSIMISNGDASKKIWMTEFGAPTGGPGALATETNYNFPANPDHVSEGLQTLIMQDGITIVRGESWAGPLIFYTYKDNGTDTSTNENFFGVIRFDGSQKPAFSAMQQLLLAP